MQLLGPRAVATGTDGKDLGGALREAKSEGRKLSPLPREGETSGDWQGEDVVCTV